MIYLASVTNSPTMLLRYKKKHLLLCSSNVEWKFHLLGKLGHGLFLRVWMSEPVSPLPGVGCGGYIQLDISLLKLQRPSLMADWHVFPSLHVGQEEHVTLVIMSVNSEAAKESSKRRPRGSRQSLKHASPGNDLITRGASRHTLDGRA